jgi:glycosyltransferase involved in cell wall biosynthesis
MNAQKPKLTVVLPCLNEAETLSVCIQKSLSSFSKIGIAGEVIVADNGSTDGSQQIARREGAIVVDAPRRGYGAALICGIQAANSEFVVMGDSDDSYALEDLELFYAALSDGHDLVMGNRFKGGIEPGAMPWLHKYVGNPILSWLGRKLFKIPVGDFHCGLRGFKKSSIDSLQLKTTGMEFASEMVVKAAIANFSIAEVPTILRPDGRSRAPHLRTWRDGWRHLKFLLLMSPKWLYGVPAAVFLTYGIVSLALLSNGPLELMNVQFGIQTIILAAISVSIGLQFFIGGVIAAKFGMRSLPPIFRMSRNGIFDRIAMKSLESLLVFGLILFIVGSLILTVSVTAWANESFGELDPYTSALYASTIGLFLTSGMSVVSLGLALGAIDIE